MLFKADNHPDEIKQYIAINQNFQFNSIKPDIKDAEALVAELGLDEETYATLAAEYDAGNLSDPMAALLPYVQRAIINYAYYKYISIGSVQVSDSGINVSRTDRAEPAPQWKVNKLESSFLNAGDKALDKLLEFLEKNTATYPDWLNSDAYTVLKENFLQTAKEASKFININGSRRVFLTLKTQINYVEEIIIRSLVCTPLYDQLKTQVKAGNLSQANADLVEKIKPIVANIALKKTIPQIRIRITDQGIMVNSFSDGMTTKTQATDKQIAELTRDLADKAQAYTDHLKKFMEDNIDSYPLYADSECYTLKADPGPRHRVQNTADAKSFWT